MSRRTSKLRRRNVSRTSRRIGHRPLVEVLEDRLAPAVLDLFTAGAFGTLNGARFEEVVSGSSTGSGVFDSFVRLQAANNDFDSNPDTEQGVNYDRAGGLNPQYDEGNSPTFNRKLALSEVPIVDVEGTFYRELFLDINQLNSDP
jgi:hypothetical protein